MEIFGFNITRVKKGPPQPVSENRGGWFPIIRESYAGAWQHNVTVDRNSILSHPVVWACITRIASDASEMPATFQEQDGNGIWNDRNSPAFTPVLTRPNGYQNHIQFKESYFLSKLIRGNTYVLKGRDARGVVNRMWVLDPDKAKPLVTDDGEVYYELKADDMAGGQLMDSVIVVPASEIIHDRYNTLYHPLVGSSPLFAAGVAATQGQAMQGSATRFFSNSAQPGGILSAPGAISNETATRLKETWQANFTGDNAGKIAVVGDGLSYTKLSMTAEESQFVDQLQWTSDAICAAFHMPPFMIGFSALPANSTVEMLTSLYYSMCLKKYVQQFEACMTEGLGLGGTTRVALDEDNLLRMDKSALYTMIANGIRGGFLAPNEGRRMDNRPPIAGGDTVYLQEQDHSLEALARRDAQPDPFGTAPAPAADTSAPAEPDDDEADTEDTTRAAVIDFEKHLREAMNAAA